MKEKLVSVILIIIIVTFNFDLEAQRIKIGGWGSPLSGNFTYIGDRNPLSENSDFAFMISFKGAVLVENFILGIFSSFLVNEISYDCSRTGVSHGDYSDGWGIGGTEVCNDQKNPGLQFHYHGLFAGYALPLGDIVSVELTNSMGFGTLRGGSFFSLFEGKTYNQEFFVYEPAVAFFFTPKKWLSFGFNFSYRLAFMLPGNEYNHYSSEEISTPSFGVEVRFGYFKFRDILQSKDRAL